MCRTKKNLERKLGFLFIIGGVSKLARRPVADLNLRGPMCQQLAAMKAVHCLTLEESLCHVLALKQRPPHTSHKGLLSRVQAGPRSVEAALRHDPLVAERGGTATLLKELKGGTLLDRWHTSDEVNDVCQRLAAHLHLRDKTNSETFLSSTQEDVDYNDDADEEEEDAEEEGDFYDDDDDSCKFAGRQGVQPSSRCEEHLESEKCQ
ncbi:hypothetical protein DPMN_052033 [Dreissena polymorpha]|uniref:Uncharacterized protein n=1 Tax=Dreissena polymorpha TaxID=45954 RepID=A0A9D4HPG2_DREPO|nr:hypothetical protein DPMN_052033 [Dreissena polymorpha]